MAAATTCGNFCCLFESGQRTRISIKIRTDNGDRDDDRIIFYHVVYKIFMYFILRNVPCPGFLSVFNTSVPIPVDQHESFQHSLSSLTCIFYEVAQHKITSSKIHLTFKFVGAPPVRTKLDV